MILEREEGSLLLDGAPSRRWVSIIAVVIPVGAFVLLAALFIRTYIVPPTYGIPNPMTTAEAPPAPPSRAVAEAQPKSQDLPMLATLAVAPPSPPSAPAASPEPLKQVASVGAAPASVSAPVVAVPPARAPEPAVTVASAASAPPVAETTGSRREMSTPEIIAAEPAAAPEEATSPIAGPVPLPRSKPHHSVAVASRGIPLPRPKPVEEAPESDLPSVDRHAVN